MCFGEFKLVDISMRIQVVSIHIASTLHPHCIHKRMSRTGCNVLRCCSCCSSNLRSTGPVKGASVVASATTCVSHTETITPCPFFKGWGILKKRKSPRFIATVRLSLFPKLTTSVAAVNKEAVLRNTGDAQVAPVQAGWQTQVPFWWGWVRVD